MSQPSTSVVCLDTDEGNIYKVGDVIDARDPKMGAWFEANIVDVIKDKNYGHTKHSSLHTRTETTDTETSEASSSKADVNQNTKSDDSNREETPMNVDDNNKFDETDGSSATKAESAIDPTILSPKKVNTFKENANAGGSSTMRSLFKKDVSDDLKKQGILSETTVSDGFIYKITFDG